MLPKTLWLDASAGKGLEINGTMARREGHIYMDMTFKNTTAQAMGDFAIQFNKNSFGLAPAAALAVPTLAPNATHDTSLPINNLGAVQKMDPLSKLQVAVKTSVDVVYFSIMVPFHVLFAEDGKLGRSKPAAAARGSW